jgi:Cys-tRNA(Pro)/Cys-tRNA(Cys) deacylase
MGYGEEAAVELGVDPSQVFKTLIAELHDGEVVVSIVPVVSLLDLKALAKVSGSKKAIVAETSVAERRTGYVIGGISPFGQTRQHRTFVDISAYDFDEIYVSGGKRGLEVVVSPSSLEHVLGATYAPLTGKSI